MPTSRAEIAFRPVGAGDLPLLARWMRQPHWRRWWGEPETELGYVRDMIEGRDTTRPFVFSLDDEPTGYIQYWFVDDHRCGEWLASHPWLGELPTGSVGVDVSIGPATLLSKGIGAAVVRAFAERLWRQGYRAIIIDPHPDNRRAVRAYEKAGFCRIAALQGRYEDVLLMRFASGAEDDRADTR